MDLGRAWQRVELAVRRARRKSGWLDHAMATLGLYGRVDGTGLSGAVTYFAFLAFFPIIALAFFVVGQLAIWFPDARADLESFIDALLPELIGSGEGQVSFRVFQNNAARVGLLGLAGFVYAGLGWMSAMRNALQAVFEKPQEERPNIFVGKLRDLMTMGVVGVLLLAAFVLTTLVNTSAGDVIEALGLDPDANRARVGIQLVGAAIAVVLITTLLMVLYRLLARPHVSHRALREGAVIAALGFVVLKLVADRLVALTHGQPAFTVFGFGLVLLVLVNYFSRVVIFGAAWAQTSQRPRDLNQDAHAGPHWRAEPE